MTYYIKHKQSGEWQVYGYEDDWIDDDNNFMRGYYYLYGDEFDCATEFSNKECAENAIWSAEEDLENYEIVEVQ